MCLEGCVLVPWQTGVGQAFQLSGMSDGALLPSGGHWLDYSDGQIPLDASSLSEAQREVFEGP